MSIELKRTIAHLHDDGSESVIHVKTIRFSDGDRAILISNEYDVTSVAISGRKQLEEFIRAVAKIGDDIFPENM